ncbi:hypothetical protein [Plantactinospora sp. KLBMP9567]|uniref:hypothetical protein n=1 Tax=Plantactinospora sp. KLBMP9567 TaxID=3085900 RepID=UPI00298167D4|nr:hypothetical protein [Plantactinospora sp. KLBMP9567]MDW5327641.1 hypothetical protein [Plantactinospora sp. KLBMP9567]
MAIFSGSGIRVSWDGGHDWRQTVLPEDVEAGGNAGAAALAIGDRAAYTVGRVDGELPVYRSVDPGRTWRRTAARVQVGPGASAVAVPGGYAQSGNQDSSGGWLSPDGITWSYVGPPTIER